MIAPSTQTYTDRIKHIKVLGEEITNLIKERDTNITLANEAKESLLDIQNRKVEIENAIVDGVIQLESIEEVIKSYIQEAYTVVRATRDVIVSEKEEIKSLAEKIASMNASIDSIVENISKEHTNILKETEQLGVLKQDLDIYKSRIEKVVEENNLPISIII